MTVEEQHQRIKWTLQEAREIKGIKVKDLEELGINPATFSNVVYGRHSSSLMTVMLIADKLGYEIVIREKDGRI